MDLRIVKYHGTGNDFILIDDRENLFSYSASLIAKLCDRHFGIGADGLLLLRNLHGYDFEMVYYNSDGSTATFCGNGGRCIVAYAHSLGIIGLDCRFKAPDGEHFASILSFSNKASLIRIQMSDAIIYQRTPNYTFLNTGTFHYVQFVENLQHMDLIQAAKKIRHHPDYLPEGTNVNFAESKESNQLAVRTYEKGVEAETLSCGTGVVASAITASILKGGNQWIIHTHGGELSVDFERKGMSFSKIFLQGEATCVFNGVISI